MIILEKRREKRVIQSGSKVIILTQSTNQEETHKVKSIKYELIL